MHIFFTFFDFEQIAPLNYRRARIGEYLNARTIIFFHEMMDGLYNFQGIAYYCLQLCTMKNIVFLLLLATFQLNAQSDSTFSNDSIAVRKVIDNLFLGMKNGDSTLVGAQFADDVRMITTLTTREGEMKMVEGSLEDFKMAVGTPHKEVWDEQISDVQIQIDGLLAQVWMNYNFYLDDQLLHCGVNAMQLVKNEQGWKIVNLSDTHRRSNCY